MHVCVHVHVYAHDKREARTAVAHRTWDMGPTVRVYRPCEYSEVVHLKSLDYARLRLISLSLTYNVRELTQKDSRVIKP